MIEDVKMYPLHDDNDYNSRFFCLSGSDKTNGHKTHCPFRLLAIK